MFMGWISRLILDRKAQGITRQQLADKGKISRNQLYEWEGRGQKGFSRPKADTLRAFCDGIGEDWHVPFRILGWIGTGASVAEPRPEQDLDLIIRRLEIRLSQKPPTPERRELELSLVRARRARDAQRLADELRAELDAGLEFDREA